MVGPKGATTELVYRRTNEEYSRKISVKITLSSQFPARNESHFAHRRGNFIGNFRTDTVMFFGGARLIKGVISSGKYLNHLSNVNTATSNGKALFNFSRAAAEHMHEGGGMVPIQILDKVINSPYAKWAPTISQPVLNRSRSSSKNAIRFAFISN